MVYERGVDWFGCDERGKKKLFPWEEGIILSNSDTVSL
jgi:hypothetical protein